MMDKSANQIISFQFSHLFNGYTQAFNKQHKRTGKLFELLFRRVPVEQDSYLSRLIYYIHANPQRHGLVHDFSNFKYPSYQSIIDRKPTRLERLFVQNWYGGREEFINFHMQLQAEEILQGMELDEF